MTTNAISPFPSAPTKRFLLRLAAVIPPILLLGAVILWPPAGALAEHHALLLPSLVGIWIGELLIAGAVAYIAFRSWRRSFRAGAVAFQLVIGTCLAFTIAHAIQHRRLEAERALAHAESVLDSTITRGTDLTAADRRRILGAAERAAAKLTGDEGALLKAQTQAMATIAPLGDDYERCSESLERAGGMVPTTAQSKEEIETRLVALRELRAARAAFARAADHLPAQFERILREQGMDEAKAAQYVPQFTADAHLDLLRDLNQADLNACDAAIEMHLILIEAWGHWQPDPDRGPPHFDDTAGDAATRYAQQQQLLHSALRHVGDLADAIRLASEDPSGH
jgi:hypothetical protein